MRSLSSEQLRFRIRQQNPWWDGEPAQVQEHYRKLFPRAYLDLFLKLLLQDRFRRAIVLMGQRRAGKTVLLHQVIEHLLGQGISASSIAYLSLDDPMFFGNSIEDLSQFAHQESGSTDAALKFLFLDEIQYLEDWELYLKLYYDRYPETQCVVSGSSTVALRRKSVESGAGRFTDFLLPPVTFYEFHNLREKALIVREGDSWHCVDIEQLNRLFLLYLNQGGFPDILVAPQSPELFPDTNGEYAIQRFVARDIWNKVLTRDIPSLYGIQDAHELWRFLFTMAFNTAREVSLQDLSQESGVSKETVKRYLELLEAAFLITVVHRIDDNARHFKRVRGFKVYLTSPSLYAALFGPVSEKSEQIEALVETAIFAQWFHSDLMFYYARWERGEVGLIHLDRRQRPEWFVEVKWSDKIHSSGLVPRALEIFKSKHPEVQAICTTRTKGGVMDMGCGRILHLSPAAIYCYAVGAAVVEDPLFGAIQAGRTDVSSIAKRAGIKTTKSVKTS